MPVTYQGYPLDEARYPQEIKDYLAGINAEEKLDHFDEEIFDCHYIDEANVPQVVSLSYLQIMAAAGKLEDLKTFPNEYIVAAAKNINNHKSLLQLAVENGQFDVVKYLFELPDLQNFSSNIVCESAVRFGHLEIVIYLINLNKFMQKDSIEIDPSESVDLLYSAVNYNQLAIVKYLLSLPFILKKVSHHSNYNYVSHSGHYIMDRALANGSLELLEYLNTFDVFNWRYRPLFHLKTISAAALHGRLDIVKYLLPYPLNEKISHSNHTFDAGFYMREIIEFAVISGNLELVKYLLQFEEVRQRLIISMAFLVAAQKGHLHIIRYLLTLPYYQHKVAEYGNCALVAAATAGYLDIVNFLLSCRAVREGLSASENLVFGNKALIEAATNGHLDVVKRLYSYDEVRRSIKLSHFRGIISNGRDNVRLFLLNHPKLFAYAELHAHEMHNVLTTFIQIKFAELRLNKNTFEEENPNDVFTINDEEAQLYFYMLRHLVRRNHDGNADDIRFLLDIPAVRMIAATAVGDEENELFRLAISINNRSASEILLTVTAIRELAEQHNFYAHEARGQIDLRALAQDTESSMRALSVDEQKRLENYTNHYQPLLDNGGIEPVFTDLKDNLIELYEKKPATITRADGEQIILPVTWKEFQHVNLTIVEHEQALIAYYKNRFHTALRYLSKPNHWINPASLWALRNPNSPNERFSTFEDYKPLICLLYLAVIDEEAKPTEQYTLKGRLNTFIAELSLIGRAHNWDKTRSSLHNPRVMEEYDDLKGDNPSCFSGVKKRLFQSVQGHPFKNIIDKEDVFAVLRETATTFVQEQLAGKDLASLAPHAENYFVMQELSPEMKEVIALPESTEATVIEKFKVKYGSQFDSLEPAVMERFAGAKFPDSSAYNAILIGAGVSWDTIFKLSQPDETILESKDDVAILEEKEESLNAYEPSLRIKQAFKMLIEKADLCKLDMEDNTIQYHFSDFYEMTELLKKLQHNQSTLNPLDLQRITYVEEIREPYIHYHVAIKFYQYEAICGHNSLQKLIYEPTKVELEEKQLIATAKQALLDLKNDILLKTDWQKFGIFKNPSHPARIAKKIVTLIKKAEKNTGIEDWTTLKNKVGHMLRKGFDTPKKRRSVDTKKFYEQEYKKYFM